MLLHKTIGYIISKPQDFKTCLNCGYGFNWYERNYCVMCGYNKLRKTTKEEVEAYVRARQQDEHFCDECEVEV